MGKREGSLPPEYVKLLKVSELKKKLLFMHVFFHIVWFLLPIYYEINSCFRAKGMAKMESHQK